MIALGLVHVIERHSDELAAELIAKLETSSRTADLRKVPVEEVATRNPGNLAALGRVAAHQDGPRHQAAIF
jgi:hypothetical protein